MSFIAAPFFGFNDYGGARDMYYQTQSYNQPRAISAATNSFPPIGQFSMGTALPSPQQGQQMFNADGSATNIGIFGQNNMLQHNGTSTNNFNNVNGNSGSTPEQNQGTRETGIIEKLLVSTFYLHIFLSY
jgi:hypothetical protein